MKNLQKLVIVTPNYDNSGVIHLEPTQRFEVVFPVKKRVRYALVWALVGGGQFVALISTGWRVIDRVPLLLNEVFGAVFMLMLFGGGMSYCVYKMLVNVIGYERVSFDRKTLQIRREYCHLGKTHAYAMSAIQKVCVISGKHQGILMTYNNAPILFGRGLDDEELHILITVLDFVRLWKESEQALTIRWRS